MLIYEANVEGEDVQGNLILRLLLTSWDRRQFVYVIK